MSENTPNNLSPLLRWEIDNGYIEFTMSSITLQQMKDKLDEARKKLEVAKREVDAWQAVVALEESKSGGVQAFVEKINKSEELRKYLRSQPKGATYKMIQTHFEENGIPMGANFIYNLIDKWEEKGDVEKRDGKIYWKGERT